LDSAIAQSEVWSQRIAKSKRKKRLHFLADHWSQSEFRTERKSQRMTHPKSKMTHRHALSGNSFPLRLCASSCLIERLSQDGYSYTVTHERFSVDEQWLTPLRSVNLLTPPNRNITYLLAWDHPIMFAAWQHPTVVLAVFVSVIFVFNVSIMFVYVR